VVVFISLCRTIARRAAAREAAALHRSLLAPRIPRQHRVQAYRAESLAPRTIGSLHDIEAQERAHPARPGTQLRLRIDA
jgi:hypothetical protein